MQGVVTMSLFLFIILHVTGLYIVLGDCPNIRNSNCISTGQLRQSCIAEAENGTGLSWFQMEDACADGRLVLLRDDFTNVNLQLLLKNHLNKGDYNSTQFLAIGMVMSLKEDNSTFLITPADNETFSCGSQDTGICLSSSATQEHCNSIGCCWLNGKCQYPEHQWLTRSNESDAIDTSGFVKTTERICIGLEQNNSTWIKKAYNCSLPASPGTGYVCEYKCGDDWPAMSQQNVSWTRKTSTGSTSSTTTTTQATTPTKSTQNDSFSLSTDEPQSSSTFTSTSPDNGKRNTAATFQIQVVHTVYLGLFPLIYKMTMFSV